MYFKSKNSLQVLNFEICSIMGYMIDVEHIIKHLQTFLGYNIPFLAKIHVQFTISHFHIISIFNISCIVLIIT